jgi:hypothetical protein
MQLYPNAPSLPDYIPLKAPFFNEGINKDFFVKIQIIFVIFILLSFFLVKISLGFILLNALSSFYAITLFYFAKDSQKQNSYQLSFKAWFQKAIECGWSPTVLEFTLMEMLRPKNKSIYELESKGHPTEFEWSYLSFYHKNDYKTLMLNHNLWKDTFFVVGSTFIEVMLLLLCCQFIYGYKLFY